MAATIAIWATCLAFYLFIGWMVTGCYTEFSGSEFARWLFHGPDSRFVAAVILWPLLSLRVLGHIRIQFTGLIPQMFWFVVNLFRMR